ncbi:MAG TPA: multiheme c-type cytochrome [Aggregatilineales bacterium]|nr:multiheme c-type cytochrome [Aggregatilineales bacterium]
MSGKWNAIGGLIAILAAAALAACSAAPDTPSDSTPQPAVEPTTPPEPVSPAGSGSGTALSEISTVPVVTTASDVVGVGAVVAAEPYAIPAGDDPEVEPPQAFVMPYAITPDMQVESLEAFDPQAQSYRIEVEGFKFEWSLQPPDGSNARLLTDGGVARWQTDVPGAYVLTLRATDSNGNTATDSWTVHAVDGYVGVGLMDGDEPALPECASCHRSKSEAWAQTAHATVFSEGIDGHATEDYGPNCISCHTTGFDNHSEANNGGFDDVAREAGWEFPSVLSEGNWEQMLEDAPEVAALANVQCESCHGPGSEHVTGDVEAMGPIAIGLEYGTCAQCHAQGPTYTIPQQWENSAHADRTAHAFWYPIGEDHRDCVACHTGGGYIDAAKGLPPEERRTDYQPITCAVCHDPHHSDRPDQLRVFDQVLLPDGTNVTEAGAAATCMTCHNTRVDPVRAVEGSRFQTPHYSAAAELLSGTGGYTWGEKLPSTLHSLILEESCITCHMADTPGVDEAGAPLPGHNEVGGHTFAMTSPDGVENVEVCQLCHGESMETFTMVAKRDYDGDGRVETNEQEIDGLLRALERQLKVRGVQLLDHYPYVVLPEDASVDLKGAVYNYKLASSNAIPAHNLQYLVSLLQLSYQRLTGDELPGADLLISSPPPE